MWARRLGKSLAGNQGFPEKNSGMYPVRKPAALGDTSSVPMSSFLVDERWLCPTKEFYHAMQPISILLADDDAMIRQCLRRAVEADPRLQIRWEADNGLQALLLAQQHHPQVVLMDAQMPRMDGI
jgi:hypothetical protein